MSSSAERKTQERLKLARKIETFGYEMVPCSRCVKQNRKCVYDHTESSRCAECIRAKLSCDGISDTWEANVPRESDWALIERQKQRLEEQEEAAAAAAQEASARVLRLRKQKKLLIRKEQEMARRGLKYLNELDEAERREKEEEGRREQELAAATSLPVAPEGDVLDFSGVAFGPDPTLSPSFWEELGIGGGTLPGVEGS